jgi:hypothetical protein
VNDTVPILLSVIAATDDRPSLGNAARDAVPIILLAVFILGILFGLLLLAYVPGHVARKRCHPSAQAISICGVLGLLIWPLWIVAYIWAYTGPDLSKARPAPRPVEPRGLACDGCGRPMDISQARQIRRAPICPSCAASLDGGPPAPPPLPGDSDAWDAKARRERRPSTRR